MPEIGIYRAIFPCPSEAFILEQVAHLRRYRPTFVVGRLVAPVAFPTIRLWAGTTPESLAEYWYWLTGSPGPYRRLGPLPAFGLLHAHFGPDGAYALRLTEELEIPLLVTYHGYETVASPLALALSGQLPNYQFLWHERALRQRAVAILAVSDFIRNRLLAKGYPPERVIRHYIGVDTEKFVPGGGPVAERYVLCVGRHTRRKGIATLLRAFARLAPRHRSVHLVQVGSGPLTAELTALAARLGLTNRVRFLGNQPHARVLALMQGAEVFALASQTSGSGDCEALGIVFNEASACAVPVLATDNGGIPEAVLEGETGFLTAEGDVAALADRLDLLLSDADLRMRFGQRGREFVRDCFDIRRQTAALETLYDRFAVPSGSFLYA